MNDSDRVLSLLASLAAEEYCYLTTKGRVTGRPHEIEIWFGARGQSIYLLSGSHSSDWLKNLRRDPAVSVRIAEHVFSGTARLVSDKEEEMAARYMLAERYQEWEEGKKLSQWARTAVVVGIDLHETESI
ncbi:MAG TPA: nitroreductase family deazaflavin-dependent oxidoreductase [Anaerolineales bacterium]|nr:nitroreductase family deazaflavin-dependent oxidoreductase [Anaerolineales bacterium]